MRLFHFSEDPDIARFEPRPVAVAAERKPGMDWLNGPLVWAIEEAWQALYLFPRDCPRILVTPKLATSPEDLSTWFPNRSIRTIAFAEQAWHARIATTELYRYEFPRESFRSLDDAGMWVSTSAIEPIKVDAIADLLGALACEYVELRLLPSLVSLKSVWETTLHASGIRLRNAQGWSSVI